MFRALLSFVGLMLLFPPGQAQDIPLPVEIERALSQANIPVDHVGIIVQNVSTQSPVLAHGSELPFNPASTIKLLTTLAALDTWGPAHTFQTEILYRGEISDGVLRGDLILRGGGDPGLNVERFWLLLREIRRRGVREIQGDVLLDMQHYQIEASDPAAFDASPHKAYNAAPAALLVNYGTSALHISPTSTGIQAWLDPASLPLENRLTQVQDATCTHGGPEIDLLRQEDESLIVSGPYPSLCGNRAFWINPGCPEATTASYFRQLWQESGGTLMGMVRLGETPAEASSLLFFDSLPLSSLVRETNKNSNNVMAKMLYLNLGVARFGAPATWDKAERAVRAWLQAKDLAMPELVLENGSGLSRIERISAGHMAKLLLWASHQPLYYEFAASLPALGVEGTLRRRLKDAPEAGRAWLKSGSLNGIRNLAGYILDTTGQRKVVVFFIQDAQAGHAGPVFDAFLRWAISSKAPSALDGPSSTTP